MELNMPEKKYIINDEKLMSEWNWEENNKLGLDPNKLSFGSNKKASWKCLNNHIWNAQIIKRINGQNCPYCSNHSLLKGFNDLATRYPQLLKEWNFLKNNISPDLIFPFSNVKVWWKCKYGHEWADSPNHRISRNNGCPYCSNHRVLSGFNDKNGNLKPNEVLHGSQQKVWWKCVRNHEWQSTIASRTNGVGCPHCKKELQTSFPEQAIYFYLKKIFPDAINRYIQNKKELDIFIPTLNIGIEYDGLLFHNNKTKDKELTKDKFFEEQGITVLRIKETRDVKQISTENNTIYYVPNHMYKNLDNIVNNLIEIIFSRLNKPAPKLKISIVDDNPYILQSFLTTLKENSILNDPILAKQWNYSKNKNVNPEYLSQGSGYKVWWICDKGHEWQANINSRARGLGCPFCSNQKVLTGYNDLETKLPQLAKQWHPTKNERLTPNMVTCGSHKKVWWLCSKGHEWQASIFPRTKGVGCPYCTNQKILPGYNDLQTKFPELARQWHRTKNGDLQPNMVAVASGKKVWWECDNCGFEWATNINLRTKQNGTNCPKCSRKRNKS